MTASPETDGKTLPFTGERNGGQDLDHHSPQYRDEWPKIFDDIRESGCPVAHSGAYGGFHLVSTYEDVSAIARDDVAYSSEHDLNPSEGNRGGIVIPPSPVRAIPIETDPPRFRQFRQLLTKPLSPQAAKEWEPWVRNLTNHFIDQFIESGQGDLVLGLGNPVPAIFTMQFLGLPLDDWEKFAMPMHTVVYASPSSDELQQAYIDMFGFMTTLGTVIEERRENPRDDFLSVIAQAEIDGAPITAEEAMQVGLLVVAGGVDTTTGLLACTLDWLEQNPDVRAEIAADPELIPRATDEFLRYITPVQGNARTLTTDTEFQGCTFAAGDRVLLSWAGANRDPEAFDDPHELDIHRFPNRHQAFGIGMHRCAGSNIARLLFGVMLEEILRRAPEYVIDRTNAQPYEDIATVNGWKSLPVTFTPGTNEGHPFLPEPE